MEPIKNIIGSIPKHRPRIVDSTIEERTPIIFPRRAVQEAICPICKGAGYLRSTVTFGHPQFGKPQPCECKIQERKEKQRYDLSNASGVMRWSSYQNANFETFDPLQTGTRSAFRQARNFAANPDGWLVLAGPCGCGKTHLAVAIAKARLDAGDTVLMQTVPDLLDYLRRTFSPKSESTYDETFQKMRDADLLVLDDFGAENNTPWVEEKIFQLLNYRYNNNFMPTVITTNNTTLEGVDERIKSRLRHRDAVEMIVMNEAKDYRLK